MNDRKSDRTCQQGRMGKMLLFVAGLLPGILFATPSFSQTCPSWYTDADGDGFGTATASPVVSCTPQPGFAPNQIDCNDNSVNTPVWSTLGGDGFSPGAIVSSGISIAPDGTPFVLYRNFTIDVTISRIGVQKFNGTSWEALGTDPISTTVNMYNPGIDINSAGVPYISYLDFDAGGSANNRTSVMRYNTMTGLWEQVGSRRFSNTMLDNGVVNIAIDATDVPYVVFPNASQDAVVMKYDNSTGWQVVGAAGFAEIAGSEISMAIDGTGTPYVAFANYSDEKITVMRLNATNNWEVVGTAGFSDDYIDVPKIAISRAGIPYVAYYDYGISEVVVQKFEGGAWTKVGTTPAYSGAASYVSLAIDRLDIPYVAFRNDDVGEITVKKLSAANTWGTVASGGANGLSVSIAVAPNNIPYLSFRDLINADKATAQSIAPQSSPPTVPTLSASQSTLCVGASATLNIASGSLRDAVEWQWYRGSCGGTPVGTGTSVSVTPAATTTYYARGQGGCVVPGSCASITVTVNALPVITAQPATSVVACEGEDRSISVTASGTGLTYQWYRDPGDGSGWGLLSGATNTALPLNTLPFSSNNYQYRVEVRRTATGCVSTSNAATLTVNTLPVINTPPVSNVICEGSGNTFSAAVTGANLAYQWQVNNGSTWSDMGGETNSSLTLTGATYSMNGFQYRVNTRNTVTTCASTSTAATLTVNTTPTITTAPSSTAVCVGSNAGFNGGASGTNLSYQWQVNNGSGWNDLAGQTTTVLSLSSVASALNGNQYRLIAGNVGCTESTSTPAVLTVDTAPSITTAPSATAVCVGSNASFNGGASGTNITYQWQVNNGSGWNNLAGQTTASLSLSSVTSTLNGNQYRLLADNAGCTESTSTPAVLTVDTAPAITTAPSATAVCVGSNAGFYGGASGTNLSYQWQVNNGSGWNNLAGQTAATLAVNGVTSTLNGNQYRLIADNAGCTESTSTPAVLTVDTAPSITTTPSATAVCIGSNASFGGGASGTNVVYQWQVNTGSGWNDLAGETTTSLSLTSVTSSLNGNQYRLIADNAGCAESASTSAALTVDTAPSITTTPSATAVCAGGNASFSGGASGTNLSYQWQVNNGSGWNNLAGQTTTSLSLSSVASGLNGNQYRLIADNAGCSESASMPAVLTVDTAPTIIMAPTATAVCVGSNASFHGGASGTNVTYQWQVNNGSGWSDLSGETQPTLTVTGTTAAMNAFLYRVIADNNGCAAATSATAALTVDTAPVVATSPADDVVCAGNTANFSSLSTGTGLTYQWQVNNGGGWSDLPGATQTNVSVSSTITSMSGYTYRVVVDNEGCAPATSGEAILTVNTQPSIVDQPANTVICVGAQATFTVTTNITGLNYQWSMNDGSGWVDATGETNETLVVSGTTASMNNYEYRVTVNIQGCTSVTSDAAVMTVNASSGITTQPTDVIACENNAAGFSVQAMGTNLQYQWQVNTGSGWADVAGETDAGLTIPSPDLTMNGHQYRVVINTDGCPPVLSRAADLSVDQLPFFTLEPNSQIVCAENEVSFLATAGGTNLVYQWQVNTGSGWQDLPGESTSSLTILTATRAMDGYVYRALASNAGCLPVASGEATLTVNTEPGATGCPYVLLVSEGVSPNGDSELDHWVIQGIERYPDNRVKVYNVWGDLIFERNGYNNDTHAWRGESNHDMKVGGQTAPDGTYYYLIDLGDSSPLLRGFVVLKR